MRRRSPHWPGSTPSLRQVKVESTPPGALIAALANQDPPLTSLAGTRACSCPTRCAVAQPGCSFVELYLQVWSLWEAGDPDGPVARHSRRRVPARSMSCKSG